MKPWLFDILACPIDKHFPLDLYIFSLETDINQIQQFIQTHKERKLSKIKKENIIQIIEEKGNFKIKDAIVLQKTPIKEYLSTILESIGELSNFTDKTEKKIVKSCVDLISTEVKEKIEQISADAKINQIEEVLPELYLINKFKLEIEIKSGLLFCKKCNRWYPIIDTIPQMLPDEYRDEKKELQFLKSKKNLLDSEFINQDLKPFNL